MALGILIGFILAFIVFINYSHLIGLSEELTRIGEENLASNYTEEDILRKCNQTGSIEYITCLSEFFQNNVEYYECETRLPFHPMDTINGGLGCCKDACAYYANFLNKKNITYQWVLAPEESPKHSFLIADLYTNGTYNGYAHIDFDQLRFYIIPEVN